MTIAPFVAKKLYKEQGESSGDSKQYFFPEIGRNDTKVQTAIELLESDHIEIGKLINDYIISLKLCSTPRETSAKADSLLILQNAFNEALRQHLHDEEEIIVPAALHFGYIR